MKLEKASPESSLYKNKKLTTSIIIYLVLFYGIWSIFVMYLREPLSSSTGGGILYQIIDTAVIKNLVWTVPAFIMIKHFEKDLYFSLKESFTNKVKLKDFLIVTITTLAVGMMNILYVPIRYGTPFHMGFNFDKTYIIVLIFVGITEESVFRVWLLNAFLKEKNKFTAVLINALLFLLIHIPVWASAGMLSAAFKYMSFFAILILSMLYSWSYIKTKNILVTMFIHTAYDLLVYMTTSIV